MYSYVYIQYMIPHVFGDAVGKSKWVKVYWSRWNWNFRGPWLPPLPSTQSRRWLHTQKYFDVLQPSTQKVCGRHAMLPSMLVTICPKSCSASMPARRSTKRTVSLLLLRGRHIPIPNCSFQSWYVIRMKRVLADHIQTDPGCSSVAFGTSILLLLPECKAAFMWPLDATCNIPSVPSLVFTVPLSDPLGAWIEYKNMLEFMISVVDC